MHVVLKTALVGSETALVGSKVLSLQSKAEGLWRRGGCCTAGLLLGGLSRAGGLFPHIEQGAADTEVERFRYEFVFFLFVFCGTLSVARARSPFLNFAGW